MYEAGRDKAAVEHDVTSVSEVWMPSMILGCQARALA